MLAAHALAVGVTLVGSSARAAPGDVTEPIRIQYRAEPGCPSAEDFNTQVFRRTQSARLATSGDTARTFIVAIERRGSGLTGSLVIRQADGTTESREVAGPECGEVATVLALATALAIDPQASLEPSPEPEPPPLVVPVAQKAPDSTASPPTDLDDASAGPWTVSIGPSLEAGVTPGVALGGSLGFAWRAPGHDGPISAVGLEFSYLRTPTHRTGSAGSSFQLIHAKPELCSVALRWQGDSGVAPCLGVELGAVTGSGTDIPQGKTTTRVWSTVDIGLELFQALGQHWFIGAEGSVVLPITRYRYVFVDPNTPVYTVPGAAFAASLRVGARL